MKKSRTWDDYRHEEQDQLEDYFEQLTEIFTKTFSLFLAKQNILNIDLNDLRELTMIKHKIATIRLDRELFHVYLQMGTGQWKTMENENVSIDIDRCIWPKIVQKTLLYQKRIDNISISQKEIYEKSLQEEIEKLNQLIYHSKKEYDILKQKMNFDNLNLDIEHKMEHFLQNYSLKPFQMKFNHKMTVLNYEYKDELLYREFLHYKLTDQQVIHI